MKPTHRRVVAAATLGVATLAIITAPSASAQAPSPPASGSAPSAKGGPSAPPAAGATGVVPAPSTAGSTAASTAGSTAPSAVPSGSPPPAPVPGMAPPGVPPGHPAMPDEEEPRIPKDVVIDDPSVPSGSIWVKILDEKGKPVPDVDVTLTITRTKISEGESSTKRVVRTNDKGVHVFSGLQKGTDVVYAVTVSNAAPDAPTFTAVYGSGSFNLPLDRGFQVQLHRFPVSRSIDKLLAAVDGADTIIEIRDDQLEVQQVFDIINVGTTTWALGPDGMFLALPPGNKGLRTAETVDTHGAVGVEGKGVKWIGAFRPGRSRLAYDYKIPYDGAAEFDIEIPLPPRVMAARVRIPTRKGMTMTVDGFPPARAEITEIGVKVASTLKQGSPQDPIHVLHIRVAGIPTAGPARLVAFSAALGIMLVGVWALTQARANKEVAASNAHRDRVRLRLLDDLKELDAALAQGRIGPKAHARERAKLVDDIGTTLDV